MLGQEFLMMSYPGVVLADNTLEGSSIVSLGISLLSPVSVARVTSLRYVPRSCLHFASLGSFFASVLHRETPQVPFLFPTHVLRQRQIFTPFISLALLHCSPCFPFLALAHCSPSILTFSPFWSFVANSVFSCLAG